MQIGMKAARAAREAATDHSMTELLIVNQFSSGDLVYLNGIDTAAGRHYHLEPFPTKLQGWQHRELREKIERRTVTAPGETPQDTLGILPICGPFHHQQQILLGWERREGTSLWHSPYALDEGMLLLRDILDLISAYRIYQQRDLTVGQPVWERVCRDERGVFFPDPALVSRLAKPRCGLPPGLDGCHPPERFRGTAQDNPATDIFYLGVLIYWLLAGELPYRLVREWPTRAIVAGEMIPLFMRRPDINPAIGRMVGSMLADPPGKRPPIEVLEKNWLHYATPDHWLSSPQELLQHQVLQKTAVRRNTARLLGRGWRAVLTYGKERGAWVTILIATALILAGLGLWRGLERPSQQPLRAIRNFYQGVAVPAAFYASNEGIAQDYLAERNKRFEAAREIMDKPLVQLTGLRLVSGAGVSGQIRAEAELVEWQWNGTGWRRVRRIETLNLKKAGSGWRIVSRKS